MEPGGMQQSASSSSSSSSSSNQQQLGQDDEALSSLLLLLRSNQTKDQPDSALTDQQDETRGKPKDSFRNANIKQYTIDELRRYFHLPIVEVAKQLGICTTLLKKVCRKLKIKKWPYRQIRSITKSVQSLEMASLNDTLMETERIRYREQITILQNTLDLLIQDPNTPVVGQGAIEGWKGDGDGLGTGEGGHEGGMNNDLLLHKPKTDVAAVLAAAAATANFETSESSNKRRKQAADELKQQEDEIAAAEASSAPMMIGATVTGHSLVTQNGRQKMKFIPPIYLAPLERRKMRSQKKLVPLIEPDICNYIHIDFLPRTLLRLSGDKLDITLQEVQLHLSGQQLHDNSLIPSHEQAPEDDQQMNHSHVEHALMDNHNESQLEHHHTEQMVDHSHSEMVAAQTAEY